jgi:hypothetical protein
MSNGNTVDRSAISASEIPEKERLAQEPHFGVLAAYGRESQLHVTFLAPADQ